MAGHDRPSSPSSSHRDQAVALAYTPGEQAPRVVAKGKGLIAHEIIERAREAGVFVHESPELVGLLMQVTWMTGFHPSCMWPWPNCLLGYTEWNSEKCRKKAILHTPHLPSRDIKPPTPRSAHGATAPSCRFRKKHRGNP